MNETTKSDMIMIMHRLKRLIGSSYHQKRIDIIITVDFLPRLKSEDSSPSRGRVSCGFRRFTLFCSPECRFGEA